MSRNLMTISELSSLTKVAISTLRHYTSEGVIPVVRIGRMVRFDPDNIEKWIAEGGPSRISNYNNRSSLQ